MTHTRPAQFKTSFHEPENMYLVSSNPKKDIKDIKD